MPLDRAHTRHTECRDHGLLDPPISAWTCLSSRATGGCVCVSSLALSSVLLRWRCSAVIGTRPTLAVSASIEGTWQLAHCASRRCRLITIAALVAGAAATATTGATASTGATGTTSETAATAAVGASGLPESAGPSTPPRGDAELERQLTNILELHRANQDFVGAVLSMRMADGTTVTVTSGTKELSGDSGDVDASIPWGIGSVTKTFVAVVVLQLAEEGSIDLDAGIDGFLPDLAEPTRSRRGNSSSTPVDSASTSTSRQC